MTAKTKPRPRTKPLGRIRKCVCVTIAPEAVAVLERLRLTPGGVLTSSAVIEHLLLAAVGADRPAR
jgi:hypothetical protein